QYARSLNSGQLSTWRSGVPHAATLTQHCSYVKRSLLSRGRMFLCFSTRLESVIMQEPTDHRAHSLSLQLPPQVELAHTPRRRRHARVPVDVQSEALVPALEQEL